MSRLDLIRCFMHLPVGIIGALLTFAIPPLGVMFSVGFMFYEALEDWKINDCSFKDMFGFLLGYALASIVLVVLSLWRIL